MQITLYTFKKRSNSTKRPSGAGFGVDVLLKDGVSIYTPSFILKDFDPAYNYVKWDNRYYYVRDVVFERQNVYTVSCTIDVLRTYRDQILNTSALVKYSASDYNVNISDHRLRTNPNATYNTASVRLITNATTTGSGGTYILQYVTSNPTFGMSGVVWCDYGKALQVAGALVNSAFLDGADMVKEFGNAYNAVIGCRYVPFAWTPTATTKEIYLGSYMSGIFAGVPLSKAQETTVNVTIPWQYSDFRNNREYTSLLMFLPGYGVIDIAPEDVRGKTSIPVTLTVDGITGEGTYIVGDFFRATVNFSIPMSIGTISGNNVRALTGIVNAGLSLASGNMFGAITSATGSVMAAFQRNVGNVGNAGGLSPILATIGSDWRNVYLVSICHNTTVEPSTIVSTLGRPLNAVRTLSSLSGYVQTEDASVVADNDEMSDQINTLLDGGVFLE
jgi:hypothetical protein